MAELRYDVARLKSGGLMKQKEKDLFSVRFRIVGGNLTAEDLEKIADISRRFGKGKVHLTTRQGLEIPYVHFDELLQLRQAMEKAGLDFGSCGPRVRTVTACQGEICSNGLIDAQRIGQWIDKRFHGESDMPHKFKLAISGCPNACIKPRENDFGIQGVVEVAYDDSACTLCGICADACPTCAISVDGSGLKFDREKCIGCNDCVMVCPEDSWKAAGKGFAVFAGGKMGKFPKLGRLAWSFIESEKMLESVIAESIDFYRRNGKRSERFGDTLERLGFDRYLAEVEERLGIKQSAGSVK